MARRRSLRPDEAELWQAVARSTRPLRPDPAPPAGAPVADLPPALAPSAPPPPPPLAPFRLGEAALPRPAVALPGPVAPSPLRMDARTHARIRRGRLAPEARIDLHGMTLAEAQGALATFVMAQQGRGRRLVLVITGKGSREGGPAGALRPGGLRRAVPLWLAAPPLSALVQETAPAHARHGGEGALYLWLRRGGAG